MRVYHSIKKAKNLANKAKEMGYDRRFIQLNRNIPELKLYKGNIVEVDEFDSSCQTYTIYTGYGSVKIWKSSCREIVCNRKEQKHE